ncbi:MAG: guanylate kinase [Microbacteriaceae bacterium]
MIIEQSSAPPHDLQQPGQLMVIAGPTAVGKGTVVKYITEHYNGIEVSVSATTREPRTGEIEGESYFFLSHPEFDRMSKSGEFLEFAIVHGQNSYGTPKAPVLEKLHRGVNVILEIDIQGAFQVQKSYPEAILVFLLPPNWDELVRRLLGRGTENQKERERRLETAKTELALADRFEYQIVNTEVAEAAQQIVNLFTLNCSTEQRLESTGE